MQHSFEANGRVAGACLPRTSMLGNELFELFFVYRNHHATAIMIRLSHVTALVSAVAGLAAAHRSLPAGVF